MKNLLTEDDNIISSFLKDFSIENRFDKNRIKQDNYLSGSISNYAKNLVMTFPTMCDDSLSPSTASMISKAHERNIITMLQLLFSSAQLRGNDGVDVLRKIHTNLDVDMSIDDYIDKVSAIATGESSKEILSNRDFIIITNEMVRELKKSKHSFPTDSFSERSLNEYTITNSYGKTIIREDDDLDRRIHNHKVYDDNIKNNLTRASLKNQRDNLAFQQDKYEKDSKYREEKDRKDYRYRMRNDRLDRRVKRDELQHKIDNDEIRNAISVSQMANDNIQHQLLDQDVKKANELQPSLMVIRSNYVDSDGKIYNQIPFVAGVKSRLISVDSRDIVERLIVKNKTKVNFLNFIRATTGEIKFGRDFLLSVKQAKIDAKNAVKKGPAAKMWNVLSNRSIKNNFNKLRRKGNDASSITTLVVNQETVNVMKNEFDFDLENIRNARMIMDAYNFLGIIIADESIEVVKVLYAGNDSWEQQAYSYLEKESNDNSYRKVINLMGKMNGR